MTLDPRWTQHIRDADRKKSFANTILNSKIIVDRLRVIIQEEMKAIERDEDKEKYDSPAWGPKQAHRNGYHRAMRLMQKLLDFNDTDKGPENVK